MNSVPFLISEFSISSLAALIKEVFGAKAPDIKEKRQIQYIFNYLKGLEAKSIICETEYIDRDFLLDHQYYLTRAFHKYPNRCARLHFFSEKIDSREFSNLIRKPDAEGLKRLKGSYLGYSVIKPLPVTFMGKTCLKVYPHHEKEFITKLQKANLFGIPLEVKSIPFQEQDKTVSACATTALWTVFHATPGSDQTYVPPPSQITLSALNGELEATNGFPNKGLTDKQLIKALDAYNLKHHDYTFIDKGLNSKEQAEVINTYLSSGFPILAATKVYSKEPGNDFYEEMGDHAITIVGLTVGSDGSIENLYVHDDRVGAYVKTIRKENEIIFLNKKTGSKESCSRSYFDLVIDNDQEGRFNEIYFLDDIKVGTYHKVRVPLSHIRFTADALIKMYEKNVGNGLKEEQKINFVITLEEGNSLKTSYLDSEFLKNKEDILFTPLPKYVWRVKFKFKHPVEGEENRILDLIFDSTDIPLGNPLLATATFADQASEFFIQNISSVAIAETRSSDDPVQGFSLATKRSLGADEATFSSELSNHFGKLNAPAYVKAEELNSEGRYTEILFSSDRSLGELYDDYLIRFDGSVKYPIWVISENGTLIMGEDSGHTTLTGSSPARIGGDIVKVNGYYCIKPKSGRYAQQYSDAERDKYMKNVQTKLKILFQGEDIRISG